MNNSTTAIEVYKTSDVTLEVLLDRQKRDVWLTQKQLSQLLGIAVQNVGALIKNYKVEKEDISATITNLVVVTQDGKKRSVEHYAMDAIIYVAYRAQSTKQVWAFHEWVSSIVSRYITGDLRAAERTAYEQVKELIAIATDYNPNSQTAQTYFATIQNRLLYAITNMTAADLIIHRADRLKENMGLTSWKGIRPLMADVTIGKNYLATDELLDLQYLSDAIHSMAKLFAKRGNTMAEWIQYIDDQIVAARLRLPVGKGKHSHDEAERFARSEYEHFKHVLKTKYVQLQLL